MAEYLTWSRLFEAGGPTLIILLVCSILSFIVIIERLIYFTGRSEAPRELLGAVLQQLESRRPSEAAQMLGEDFRKKPGGYVLSECLTVSDDLARGDESAERIYEEVKGRAIAETIPGMERYLSIEATLGTVSPYIGLLGTVFGIIRAFMSLGAGAGTEANMNQLNAGIAEALIATAAGLFVAIPATIAYNHFRKRVNNMILEMEVAASRLKVIIQQRK